MLLVMLIEGDQMVYTNIDFPHKPDCQQDVTKGQSRPNNGTSHEQFICHLAMIKNGLSLEVKGQPCCFYIYNGLLQGCRTLIDSMLLSEYEEVITVSKAMGYNGEKDRT